MKNNNKNDGFAKFGKYFQESLCQIILEERAFSEQIFEVLAPEFLEFKHLQIFVLKIKEYKEKYKTHPTLEILKVLFANEINDEAERKIISEYIENIENKSNITDKEYIKETALEFCKKQALLKALAKSLEHIQRSSYDEITKEIKTAIKLGIDNNVGNDLINDFEERYQEDSRRSVPTTWPKINALMKGGLKQGQLGVLIGSTGAGKSMVLCNLGSTALQMGKNVVYYTLELDANEIGLRFDSCLTDIPIDFLKSNKQQVLESIKKIKGELTIKEYPTKSVTPNSLRMHLEKMKKIGKHVDLILVDYGDLLKPMKAYGEKRFELESIYEELRAIAKEFNSPLWTVSQSNRGGCNVEIITLESISEAFNKCFIADFIFTLSRTVEDRQKNEGRFFIAKNRNGVDGLVFSAFIDTSRVKIDILGEYKSPDDSSGEDEEYVSNKTVKKLAKKRKFKII